MPSAGLASTLGDMSNGQTMLSRTRRRHRPSSELTAFCTLPPFRRIWSPRSLAEHRSRKIFKRIAEHGLRRFGAAIRHVGGMHERAILCVVASNQLFGEFIGELAAFIGSECLKLRDIFGENFTKLICFFHV